MKVKTFNFLAESKTTKAVLSENPNGKDIFNPSFYEEDQLVSDFLSKVRVVDVKVHIYPISEQNQQIVINKKLADNQQQSIPGDLSTIRNMKVYTILYEDK